LGARHAWLGHLHVQAAQKDARLISSAKDICYLSALDKHSQNYKYPTSLRLEQDIFIWILLTYMNFRDFTDNLSSSKQNIRLMRTRGMKGAVHVTFKE
jgi:hypothetical protein